MDTRLVETFLEIVGTGSFNTAAVRMNVAQTTISARIRTLESQLGRALFTRHKGGARLTRAGEQFQRHARSFLQLAQRMTRQVAVPSGHSATLTIGGEMSLWRPLCLDWARRLRQRHPEIALRVHLDVPQDLIDRVATGVVDVAVMYAPPHRHGLRVDLLAEEKLVLATTDPTADPFGPERFLATDWGQDFARRFASGFPRFGGAGLSFNIGPLAIDYALAHGGSGYFRLGAIEASLAAGHLHLVPWAPRFSYPIYSVSSPDADAALLGPALTALRDTAALPPPPGREAAS